MNNERRVSARTAAWQGMNWISQHKRLAIYLRDNLACVYCGDAVEQGAKLTLDHVVPVSKGGTNGGDNLVTCCHRCNTSRGNRTVVAFAEAVAGYINHDVTADDIKVNINRQRKLALPKFIAQAKEMIALRGSTFKVLAAKREEQLQQSTI
jgi:hypothetical protein